MPVVFPRWPVLAVLYSASSTRSPYCITHGGHFAYMSFGLGVATKELIFEGRAMRVIERNGQAWLTAADIAPRSGTAGATRLQATIEGMPPSSEHRRPKSSSLPFRVSRNRVVSNDSQSVGKISYPQVVSNFAAWCIHCAVHRRRPDI